MIALSRHKTYSACHFSKYLAFLAIGFSICAGPAATGQKSPEPKTTATINKSQFLLANRWIQAEGSYRAGHWSGLQIKDLATQRTVKIPEAFSFTLQDGQVLRSTAMEITQPLSVRKLNPNPSASRYSEHLAGKEICTDFSDKERAVHVHWCGILRDGSNYFRQRITIHTGAQPLPATQICLLHLTDPGAHVAGTVKGSPVTDDTMFFGFEHPLSVSTVQNGDVLATLPRQLPIHPGESISYSSVVGVAPAGQMRREFLRYLERERAHPYRTFLQYNSWYDLGFQNEYDEAGALDRIHAFGTELEQKRGVKISSFLFDDGWDNPNSLWDFHSGFPHGFSRVSKLAAHYNSRIGVWLSPWGGYAAMKKERIAFGEKHGYEIVNKGFALSGPKYYRKFENTCLEMIRRYRVNEFKFDGTGNANRVFPGSIFDSDFDAAIHLFRRLRQQEPNLFINLTTGTNPSPFWLFDADSIWRSGKDHSFGGVGSSRQRWITYRDAQTYKNVVQQSPLFPLNSLMLHGIIYAKRVEYLNTDPQDDFWDEVESFFGSGTQVQEMYITPSLLSRKDWDELAKAAIWSRKNAQTLKDSHWIGGDPGRLEVYGWASWSPKKAIIVLRNPSDQPQTFALDIQSALELPVSAPKNYMARNSWQPTASSTPLPLHAGNKVQIKLKPFEVRTLDAEPVR